MNGSINFNWNDINELGKSTLSNQEILAKSNKELQSITKDISSCWQGVDASAFENSMNNLLSILNADVEYFKYLSDYFGTASNTIGGTVDTYSEMMTRMGNDIENSSKTQAIMR